jgi:hypothetical protein
MNEGNTRKWCRLFKEGRTNVHEERRIGRPSLVTDDIKEKVNVKILKNSRFTISPPHDIFGILRILRSGQDTKYVVQDLLKGLESNFFVEGTQKMAPR